MYIYITGFAGTNGTDLEILILLLFPLYQTLPVGLMCGNIRHREEDIYMHNGSTQSRGDLLVDISLHSIKFYLPRLRRHVSSHIIFRSPEEKTVSSYRNQVPYMMLKIDKHQSLLEKEI